MSRRIPYAPDEDLNRYLTGVLDADLPARLKEELETTLPTLANADREHAARILRKFDTALGDVLGLLYMEFAMPVTAAVHAKAGTTILDTLRKLAE